MLDALFNPGKNKRDYEIEYDNAVKDAEKAKADAEYNWHYNKALYDANKDYFDKMGVSDPGASYFSDTGKWTNSLADTMEQADKNIADVKKERDEVMKKNKYNYFGDSGIFSMLNAPVQYADMASDFGKVLQQAGKNVFSGDYSVDPTSEWEKRDHASDLGATIQTALMLAPMAGGIAGYGASAGASALKHPLLAKVGKGAAEGALWGGADALTTYGNDIGQHLPETAIQTALGGAIGGAAGGLGYGVDKYANRAVQTRNIKDAYQQYLNQQRAGAINDASRLLGDGGVGGSVAQDPLTEWLMGRGNLARTKLGQAVQGVGDTISINKAMGNSPLNKLTKSKAGNLTSRLLKTKTGKIGAGVGGGLLLGKLMNSGGGNSTQLSDADLEELYNYIYGGGQ